MRGLPFSATRRDINLFFAGKASVMDVEIHYRQEEGVTLKKCKTLPDGSLEAKQNMNVNF